MSMSETQYAAIAVAASGDNTIVAAVAGKKIRVQSLFLVVPSDLTVAFESGASGTPLTGDMLVLAKTSLVLPFNPNGWFQTVAGVLLNLELSGATAVGGSLSYVEV